MIYSVTGHRPNKLWGEYSDEGLQLVYNVFLDYFYKAEDVGSIMTGGALGVDTAAALVAIKLNKPVILALPFVGLEKVWDSKKAIERYYRIAEYAEQNGEVVIVSEGDYSGEKLFIRNKYMVDNSDRLVALHNPKHTSGGTAHCINYATGKIPIINLWDNYKKRIVFKEQQKG